jgi:phosphohistidine phosphatase
MRVLLVRHAEAVDMRSAPSDHDRWLTEEGRRTATSVGRTLAMLGLEYARMYTSPLVRAVQTAEVLAATHPGFDGPLEVHRALSVDEGTTAQAVAPLQEADDDSLIVMVGHMPKVGVMAGFLGQLPSPPSFQTGAACLIRVEGREGQLEWMLDPYTLERRAL